jgi:hypothetical protein
LLIELGSGSERDGDGVISALPSALSVSAPAVQQRLDGAGGEGTFFNLKGRERAITLASDESNIRLCRRQLITNLRPTAYHDYPQLLFSQALIRVYLVVCTRAMPLAMVVPHLRVHLRVHLKAGSGKIRRVDMTSVNANLCFSTKC